MASLAVSDLEVYFLCRHSREQYACLCEDGRALAGDVAALKGDLPCLRKCTFDQVFTTFTSDVIPPEPSWASQTEARR